jgi:hypothetical protein
MLENDVSDLRKIRDRSSCIQDMFVRSTERFNSENIVSSSSSSKNLHVPLDEAIPLSSTHRRHVMIMYVCYMTNVPYVMISSFCTSFRVLTQVAALFLKPRRGE